MPTNRQIITKADDTLTTSGITSGLLSPEQSRQFLKMTFEATPLGQLVRHEMRRARSGEIDKIGIASRILREKVENTDPTFFAKPTFSAVQYATTQMVLPWEITEDALRENIEGQSLEAVITNLMTTQMGIDREDLCLNGDAETLDTDPDYNFLKVNDGWVKQISEGGHVVDRSTVDSGKMSINVFYSGIKAMPNKYNNNTLRWLMSPHRQQQWEEYILGQAVTVGGIISDRRVENPAAIPVVPVPRMPDDKIILTNPKNLIVVDTYGVQVRKTTEGREAIMKDKRFYAVHFDYDPIIEELDATVIIEGLADIA